LEVRQVSIMSSRKLTVVGKRDHARKKGKNCRVSEKGIVSTVI